MSRLSQIVLSGLFLALLFAPSTGLATDTPENVSDLESTLLRFANKFYAITLTAASTQQSTEAIQKDYPQLIVYQTHVLVAGTRLHFVRLGFFASRDEASSMLEKVHRRYPDAWVAQVTPLEQSSALGIDLETQELAAAARHAEPQAVTPPPPVALPPTLPPAGFAVQLDKAANPQFTPPRLPDALRRYQVYVLRLSGLQGTEYQLNLGVFADRTSAEQARATLRSQYPLAVVREIRSSERDQVAALPASKAPAVAAKPAAPVTTSVTQQARALLAHAQDQIIARQYDAAIKTLTQILVLPKNEHTADAIEYTGIAYDRAGQIDKAIFNYQVYLRVYPNAPGVERVRQRLLALQSAPKPLPPKPAAPASTAVAQLNTPHVVGTLSQFYYRGASRSSVNVPTAGEAPLLTSNTEATLSTSLNMTATYQTERFDNRFVLRDNYTYIHSYDQIDPSLPSYDTNNYLTSAYLETKDKRANYTTRAGRLLGTNWGIFGRYDGAQLVYNFSPGWRAALTTGSPQEYDVDANRFFYAVTLDAGPIAKHWFGNLYFMHQDVDNFVDREAVGTELRFTDRLRSAYMLLDYDTSYQKLNVGVFTLNWGTRDGLTYNLLLDHRLLPTLQTTNAVFGNVLYNQSFSVLEESGLSEAEIRKLALDRTVTANTYSAGVNWQVNRKWQFGGDVRMYNVSAVPAIDPNPAIPGTGDIYVYTVQGRYSGLFTPKDFTQVSLGHKAGESAEGNTLSFTNTTPFSQAWSLDTRLRISKEHTQSSYTDFLSGNLIESSSDTALISPSLHLSYRLRSTMLLEAEYGYERSSSKIDDRDTVTGTHTYSNPDVILHYFSVGYRWNF